MKKTCATCRFYVENDDRGHGKCHRYPPAVIPEYDDLGYPYVGTADWCGEYMSELPEAIREEVPHR